uniref:Uncharacterized protein n=1 Tax=Anopheles farauti TaxID=69004 RepID=A0A182QJF1_9DIPT
MMDSDKLSPGKETDKDKNTVKKGRSRQKHKFNSIRRQMEFYFSDANLTKDRYLGQLVQRDPFIPLEEFLKFNKIKVFTTSAEDIANALTNSTLLELSEDRTKVRRKTELVVKPNCEECTIYVECLPPKATHEWVRNVFSSYGDVAYVSLPKFKHSRKIKEFGFVEFVEEAGVQKALKAFQTFGGVLAYETTDPAKMASIKTYQQEQAEMQETGSVKEEPVEESTEALPENDDDGVETKPSDVVSVLTEVASKEEEDSIEPPAKRHKGEPASEDDDTQDTHPQSDQEANDETKREGASDEEAQTDQEELVAKDAGKTVATGEQSEPQQQTTEADATGGKKKCRQRKGCSIVQKEIQMDDKVYELKILTKKEWRRLRNKYLNLQKEEAKKLKRLFVQTDKHHHPRGHSKATATSLAGASKGPKSIKSSPRVNFYGAMPIDDDEAAEVEDGESKQQPDEAEESAALAKRRPLFSFEPGLIVSVKFREPCVDVKDFRAELRQYPYVKYIDVKEGDFEAFVRVDKPASANALVKEYSSAEHSAQILSGELEQQYWGKMMRDREDKLNKRVKTERVRGRTKLIRKINNHIKFDDDDD